MTSDTITIGITAFNAQNTIERAIASCVYESRTKSVDLIVVDDASTDGTGPIVQRLSKEINGIQYIRHEDNLGVACARNTILEHTKTEFLAYLDDDDENMPNRLDNQLARLRETERIHGNQKVICFGDRIVVSDDHLKNRVVGLGINRCAPIVQANDYLKYVFLSITSGRDQLGLAGAGTMFTRTEVLRSLSGFDPALRRCEEQDLLIRAALKGYIFVSTPNTVITQHKTHSPDKAYDVEHRAGLIINAKHQAYLKSLWAFAPFSARFNLMYTRASCRKQHFLRRLYGALLLLSWPPKDINAFLFRKVLRRNPR